MIMTRQTRGQVPAALYPPNPTATVVTLNGRQRIVVTDGPYVLGQFDSVEAMRISGVDLATLTIK